MDIRHHDDQNHHHQHDQELEDDDNKSSAAPSESDISAVHDLKRTALELDSLLLDLEKEQSSNGVKHGHYTRNRNDDDDDDDDDVDDDQYDKHLNNDDMDDDIDDSERSGDDRHAAEQQLRAELDAAVVPPPWRTYQSSGSNGHEETANEATANLNGEPPQPSIESSSVSRKSHKENNPDQQQHSKMEVAVQTLVAGRMDGTSGSVLVEESAKGSDSNGCHGVIIEDGEVFSDAMEALPDTSISMEDAKVTTTAATATPTADGVTPMSIDQEDILYDVEMIIPEYKKANWTLMCKQLCCALVSIGILAGIIALIFRGDDNGSSSDTSTRNNFLSSLFGGGGSGGGSGTTTKNSLAPSPPPTFPFLGSDQAMVLHPPFTNGPIMTPTLSPTLSTTPPSPSLFQPTIASNNKRIPLSKGGPRSIHSLSPTKSRGKGKGMWVEEEPDLIEQVQQQHDDDNDDDDDIDNGNDKNENQVITTGRMAGGAITDIDTLPPTLDATTSSSSSDSGTTSDTHESGPLFFANDNWGPSPQYNMMYSNVKLEYFNTNGINNNNNDESNAAMDAPPPQLTSNLKMSSRRTNRRHERRRLRRSTVQQQQQ